MMCKNKDRTEANYENYSDYFLEVDNKNRLIDSFLLVNNNDSPQAPYYNKHAYESLLKATQKERKDKQGRECYIIDIYRKALSLRGIISLPWEGYDEAILITHSEYVNDEISYIDSGISVPGSNQNIYIQVSSSKNVHTYGCHLSGKPGGCVQVSDVLNMILEYLNNLKVGECCLKATRIQIVSARLTNVPISL